MQTEENEFMQHELRLPELTVRGMVLGAMAGQLGLIFISDWGIVGIPGLLLAMIISLPISIFLGWLCGSIMNLAKGREMVTGFILAFFMNGLYMLVVLYAMGSIIPIFNQELLLSRGYGIRNVVGLDGVRQCLDLLIPLKIGGLQIPVFSFMIIGAVSGFIIWFRKTKIGQDMRAVGQDRAVAGAAGLLVTHEPRHAAWADRVVYLRDGVVVDGAATPLSCRSATSSALSASSVASSGRWPAAPT